MTRTSKPIGLIAGAGVAAGCTVAMFLAPSEMGRLAARLALSCLVLTMLASAFIQWRFGRQALGRIARRALLLTGIAAVALTIAELAVRVVYRDLNLTSESNSYFAHRTKPQSEPALNSLGLREKEIPPVANPGVFRIAVIGDSITWGAGIARQQRFTELLANSLNENGKRFEVLNFGQRGANLLDHLALLKDTVLPLDPDFVLLQWSIDDYEGLSEPRPRQYNRLAASEVLANYLQRHSALYFMLDNRLARAKPGLGLAPDYEQHLDARFGDLNSGESKAADKALDRFIELAAMRRIGVGIVAFPPLVDGVAMQVRTPSDYLVNRVMGACTAYGLICLDLRGALNVPEGLESLRINAYEDTPGAQAHAIVAEAIALIYAEDWRIGSLRRGRRGH